MYNITVILQHHYAFFVAINSVNATITVGRWEKGHTDTVLTLNVSLKLPLQGCFFF